MAQKFELKINAFVAQNCLRMIIRIFDTIKDMNKKVFYIVGNWKSNKGVEEGTMWMQEFERLWKKQPLVSDEIRIVLCPSFVHMSTLQSLIQLAHLPIMLGTQNISAFAQGAYTGELSAEMVKGMAMFSLVGHSERRKYFRETEADCFDKITQAKSAGIEPVYCVQGADQAVPLDCDFVAYEPVWAIGTGQAESSDAADQTIGAIKEKIARPVNVLYGGSVSVENVTSYVKAKYIDGVLIGGASLKPDAFFALIRNASQT